MSLHDLLASDMRQAIADHPDEVTVHQNGNDVGPFNALVVRGEPGADQQTGLLRHEVRILIQRSADPTVGVSTIDPRTDEVSVAFRRGEPAQRARVLGILSQNAGFIRVLVGR